MRRFGVLVVCVAAAFVWLGNSSTSGTLPKRLPVGALMELSLTGTDSLADNGIDTMTVDMADAKWTSGSCVVAIINRASAAVDSVHIGIDVSADSSVGWSEVFSLANDGTNLNGAEQKNATLSTYGRYWRFRIENQSGDTLTTSIRLNVPTK